MQASLGDFPVFRITSKFYKVPSWPTFLHLLFFCAPAMLAGLGCQIPPSKPLPLLFPSPGTLFPDILCDWLCQGTVNSHLHTEDFPYSFLNSSPIGFNFHDNNYHDFIFFLNTFPHIYVSLFESKLDEGRDLVYPFNAASQVSRTVYET